MLSTSSTNPGIRERAEEIEQLTANSQLDLVTKRLMDFSKDFGTSETTREAILIRNTFTTLRTNERRYQQEGMSGERAKLVLSIVGLKD